MISFESKFNLYIFLAILIALLMVVCIFIQIIIIKKILRSDKEDVISSKKSKSELTVKNEEILDVKENTTDLSIKEENKILKTPIVSEDNTTEVLKLDHSKNNDISSFQTYNFIEHNPKSMIVLRSKEILSHHSQDYEKRAQKAHNQLNDFTEEQHLTSVEKEERDGKEATHEDFMNVEPFVQEKQPVIETADQTVNLHKEIKLPPSMENAKVDLVLADETKHEKVLSIEEMNENIVDVENLNQIEESESIYVQKSTLVDQQDKNSIEKNINFKDTLLINIEKKILSDLENIKKVQENELEEVVLIDQYDHELDVENLNQTEDLEPIHVQKSTLVDQQDKNAIGKNINPKDALLINIEKEILLDLDGIKKAKENKSDEVIIVDQHDHELEDENLNQIEDPEPIHVQKSILVDQQDKNAIEKNINPKDALLINIEEEILSDLDSIKKAKENELDEMVPLDQNDQDIEEDHLEIKEVIHLDMKTQHLDNEHSLKKIQDNISSEEISEEEEFDDYSHLLIKPIPIHIKRNETEEVKPLILAPEIHSEAMLSELDSDLDLKSMVGQENLTVAKGLNQKIDFRYTTSEYFDKFSHNKDIINVKNIDKDISSKAVINEMNAAVNRMTSLDTKKEFDFKKILDTYHQMSDMYK